MCGRTSISKKEIELEKRFKAKFAISELEKYHELPLFNIGPSMSVPIITADEPDKIQWVKWGFIPSWASDNKATPPQINARKESVLEKPYFREAIQKRRCLVLLDGYFEWKVVNKATRIPYFIHLKNNEAFAVAGIYEKWNETNAFSLITQEPNDSLTKVHDRMPAILLPEQEKLWLDKAKTGKESVSLIYPYPQEKMNFYTVSKRLNGTFNNDPKLLIPTPYDSVAKQENLF